MVRCTSFIALMSILLSYNANALHSKLMVNEQYPSSSKVQFVFCIPFIFQDPQFLLTEPSDVAQFTEELNPQQFILFQPPSYEQMNMQPRHQTKDPSEFSSENLIKVSKRNPACIRRCLGRKVLHPAQCHYVC